VGIGVNFIGRKVGEEIKKFIQLIFEARKDDNRNALLYNAAGDDSVPLNEERIILVKVDGTGKYVAVGVLTPSQGAKPGEKIFFARDPDAAIVSKISMLNDGSITVDTDTETTDSATGNYTRKIKGETDIVERKNRTYKNEKDVSNTIEGDKKEAIKKNDTITIEGDKSIEISGDNTKTIGGDENIGIEGDKTENITGNATESTQLDKVISVGGGLTIDVGGSLDITAAGNVTINGQTINLN
jgi:hypothetical protein